MFLSWWRPLVSRPSQPAPRGRRARRLRRAQRKPWVESLEDRTLLSAGTFDPAFNGGVPITADLQNEFALNPSVTALLGGQTQVVGVTDPGGAFLQRYDQAGDAPGTLVHITNVNPFNTNGANPSAMVSLPSGQVLTATGVANAGQQGFDVARYNPDGSLDASFNSGTGAAFFPLGSSQQGVNLPSLVVEEPGSDPQNPGKILVADRNAAGNEVLARLNADGSADTAFNGSSGAGVVLPTDVYALAVYPSSDTADAGKLLVALPSQGTGTLLRRYDADGQMDSTFGSGGQVSLPVVPFQPLGPDPGQETNHLLLIQPDGEAVVAGAPNNASLGSGAVVERLDTHGNPDPQFGTPGTGKATLMAPSGILVIPQAIALQADGKIVLAGSQFDGATNSFAIGRLANTGQTDSSFGTSGLTATTFAHDAFGTDLAVQPADGNLLVAGIVKSSAGVAQELGLARYQGGAASTGTASAVVTYLSVGNVQPDQSQPPWDPHFSGAGGHSAQGDLLALSDPNDHTPDTAYYSRTEPAFNMAASAALEANFQIERSPTTGSLLATAGSVSLGMGDGAKLMQLDLVSVDKANDTATFALSNSQTNLVVVHNADHLNTVRIVKNTADGMVHVLVNGTAVLDTAYSALPGDTNPNPGTFLFGATAGGSVTQWDQVRYVVGDPDPNAVTTAGAGDVGAPGTLALLGGTTGPPMTRMAAVVLPGIRPLAQSAAPLAATTVYVQGDVMIFDFTYPNGRKGTAPKGAILLNVQNETAQTAEDLPDFRPANAQETTLSNHWLSQFPLGFYPNSTTNIFPSGPGIVWVQGSYPDGTQAENTFADFTIVDASANPAPTLTVSDDQGQSLKDTADPILNLFGSVYQRAVTPGSTFLFNVQGQAINSDEGVATNDRIRLLPINPLPAGMVLTDASGQPVQGELDGTGTVNVGGRFTADPTFVDQDIFPTAEFNVTDLTTGRSSTVFLRFQVVSPQDAPGVVLHTAQSNLVTVQLQPGGETDASLEIGVDRAVNALPQLTVLTPTDQVEQIPPEVVQPNHLVGGQVLRDAPNGPNLYTATYKFFSDAEPGSYIFQASATDPTSGVTGFSEPIALSVNPAQVIQAAADAGNPDQEMQQVAGQQNPFQAGLNNVGQAIQQAGSFVLNGLGNALNAAGNGIKSAFTYLTTPRQSVVGAQNVYVFTDSNGGLVALYTRVSPFDPVKGLLPFSEVVRRDNGQGSLVSRGGGSLVSRGGGSLVSRGGGSVAYTGPDGATKDLDDSLFGGYGNLVSRGGGSLVSRGGGSFRIGEIFATGGANLVSRGGGSLLPLPNLSAVDLVSRGGGSISFPDFNNELDLDRLAFKFDPNSILGRGSGNFSNPSQLVNPSQLAGIQQNTSGADGANIPADASMILGRGSGNLTGMSVVAQQGRPLALRAGAAVAALAAASTTPAGLPAAPGAAAFDALLHAQFLLWEDELLQSNGGGEPASPTRTDLGFAELKAAAAVLQTNSYDGLTADQVTALQRAENIIQLHVAPATPGAAIVPGSRIVLTPVTSGVSLATATATPADGQATAIALGGTVATIGGDIPPSPEPGVPTIDVPLFGQDLPLVAAAPGQVVAQLPDFVAIGVPQLIALTTADGRLAFGAVTLQPSAGAVQFGAPTYTADPSGGTATVTVTRTGGSAGEVVVDFATADGSAQAGTDYTRQFGTVVFADGDTAPKTIAIPLARTQAAGDRTISVSLSDLIDGTAFGANAATTVVLPGTAPQSSGAHPSSGGGPSLSPSQRLVAQAFADLLGQLADAGNLAALAGRLDRGASPLQVVRDIERLPGFATRLVKDVYHRLLHRLPHNRELKDGLSLLNHGSLQELEAQVLAGTAYFTERAGGTGAGFRYALVRDLLGLLAAPAADAATVGALQDEPARLELARRALQTLGSDQRLARVLYELAHVRANQHGFRRAIDLLQAGQSGQDVLARIVAATLGGPAL